MLTYIALTTTKASRISGMIPTIRRKQLHFAVSPFRV